MFYCGYTDLDNDGDIDVLGYRFDYYGASSGFYYFQNTGTAAAPAFGAPQANPFGLNGALPAAVLAVGRFADMDNDGDDDFLAASFYGGGFRYFQNTGTPAAPQFAAPVNNPFGLTSAGLGDIAFVEPVDIDLDGDLAAFGAMRLQNMGNSVSLFAGINGQLASKNLDVSEKMELGGLYGVRAYPSGDWPPCAKPSPNPSFPSAWTCWIGTLSRKPFAASSPPNLNSCKSPFPRMPSPRNWSRHQSKPEGHGL
jgi:hypothetical protein